jgi:hypothetical protein
VVLCRVVLFAQGDSSWGADDFYVVPVSQWKHSGSNIYYNAGNVGINYITPPYLLSIYGNGSDSIYSLNTANGGTGLDAYSIATSGAGQGVHGQSESSNLFLKCLSAVILFLPHTDILKLCAP